VVGGRGFAPPPAGVTFLSDLNALDAWGREFSRGFSPN
jgi:hypothetical protein